MFKLCVQHRRLEEMLKDSKLSDLHTISRVPPPGTICYGIHLSFFSFCSHLVLCFSCSFYFMPLFHNQLNYSRLGHTPFESLNFGPRKLYYFFSFKETTRWTLSSKSIFCCSFWIFSGDGGQTTLASKLNDSVFSSVLHHHAFQVCLHDYLRDWMLHDCMGPIDPWAFEFGSHQLLSPFECFELPWYFVWLACCLCSQIVIPPWPLSPSSTHFVQLYIP